MTTGISAVQARQDEWLKFLTQGTAPGALTTPIKLGLFGAPAWQASHAYSLGDFVLSTHTGNAKLFKCTTAGTSGAADPFSSGGTETVGQAVTDGTVTWTEQTHACEAIADGTAAFISELVGSGYARVSTSGDWAAVSDPAATATGSLEENSAVIAFAAATADWDNVVGWFLVDSSATVKYLAYGFFSSQQAVSNTTTPQFNTNALQLTAD